MPNATAVLRLRGQRRIIELGRTRQRYKAFLCLNTRFHYSHRSTLQSKWPGNEQWKERIKKETRVAAPFLILPSFWRIFTSGFAPGIDAPKIWCGYSMFPDETFCCVEVVPTRSHLELQRWRFQLRGVVGLLEDKHDFDWHGDAHRYQLHTCLNWSHPAVTKTVFEERLETWMFFKHSIETRSTIASLNS